jgi:hypothetical protein
VLLQLRLDQRECQPRTEERDVRLLAQEVGDGTDVVLVAVVRTMPSTWSSRSLIDV